VTAIYEHFHTVSPDEIDGLGHANNLAYLKWMIAAATAHSKTQGWPSHAYRALGAGWVVRSHEIKYAKPAFSGERLVVYTWVADMKKFSSLRRYKIVRCHDDELLATAATGWAFVDYATGSLRRIPPEVSGAYRVVAADDPDSPL